MTQSSCSSGSSCSSSTNLRQMEAEGDKVSVEASRVEVELEEVQHQAMRNSSSYSSRSQRKIRESAQSPLVIDVPLVSAVDLLPVGYNEVNGEEDYDDIVPYDEEAQGTSNVGHGSSRSPPRK